MKNILIVETNPLTDAKKYELLEKIDETNEEMKKQLNSRKIRILVPFGMGKQFINGIKEAGLILDTNFEGASKIIFKVNPIMDANPFFTPQRLMSKIKKSLKQLDIEVISWSTSS